MSKTPYEIRLELLKMAQDQLTKSDAALIISKDPQLRLPENIPVHTEYIRLKSSDIHYMSIA